MVDWEEQKQKAVDWFKIRDNQILFVILVAALAIRIHYFLMTNGQGVWWDEGEYLLKANSVAFGTPDSGWWWARPILLPVMLAGLFKVGLGELGIRFIYVLVSTLSVYFVYRIAESTFSNKWAAQLTAIIMGGFWLEIFLMTRFLTEPIVHFFLIATVWFYLKGCKKMDKNLYWAAGFAALAFLTKWTAALIAPALLVHTLVVNGKKTFNRKMIYAFLIGLLIVGVYFGYNNSTYGSPTAPIDRASEGFGVNLDRAKYTFGNAFNNQVGFIKGYFGTVNFYILLTSFAFFLLDIYIYRKHLRTNKVGNMVLIISLAVSYVWYISYIYSEDNRNIFPSSFAMVLMVGYSIDRIGFWLKENEDIAKWIGVALVVAFLYSSLPLADGIIKSKIGGYGDLRDTGNWLRANTNESDKILSAAIPELTYYTQREVIGWADNASDSLDRVDEAKFIVLSAWERHPDYVNQEFVNLKGLQPVQQFGNSVILSA